MITYKSTRGNKKVYTFSEAILKGIADDGGLLIPNKIPTFTVEELEKLKNTSYAEKALFILDLLETDLSTDVLKQVAEQAYGKQTNFFNKTIAPVTHLKDNQYILELWHGPTWAFKDMALQLMPLLFSEAIKIDNKKRKRNGRKALQYHIVVATSGDTGKAALEGYKNKKNISITVFFPDKKVSTIQELSMITQEGENISVYPVYGDFDDIQSLVKNIFTDAKFKDELFERLSISLSAANSINWGRFLPQVIYHISSYINLLEKNIITLGDEIDIAIPTGNFSNMLAAYIAKKMGLPLRKFICASNANNVLTEFFHTGVFDAAKRSMIETPSPAMDILIPSNIERLLYFMTNDTNKIKNWMKQLQEKRKFIVDKKIKKQFEELFYADWVSNEDCLKCIKTTFDETGYLIDPHTAVVKEVVNRYKKTKLDQVPIVICSTAHWAKFPNDVYKALTLSFRATRGSRGISYPRLIKYSKHYNISKLGGIRSLHSLSVGRDDKNEFEIIKDIQNYTKFPVPKNLLELKQKPILYKEKLQANKKELEEKIISFLISTRTDPGQARMT